MRNTHFEVILFGQGWKTKSEDPTDVRETAPDTEMMVKVTPKYSCFFFLFFSLSCKAFGKICRLRQNLGNKNPETESF